MTDDLSAAEHAAAIDQTRQELLGFVTRCTQAQWLAAPVSGDPRPVGVIADHVAHSYEYLAGWIGDLLGGHPSEVDSDIVDGLNAVHAAQASPVTPDLVTEHLRASGDVLIGLVSGLSEDQLRLADGQVARFAVIAARHARSHREELEEALEITAGVPSIAQE
jgi:hypothetical protein